MSQGSTDLIKNPNVLNDALKHYAKRLTSFDNDKEIQTILPEIVQKELNDIINDILDMDFPQCGKHIYKFV